MHRDTWPAIHVSYRRIIMCRDTTLLVENDPMNIDRYVERLIGA